MENPLCYQVVIPEEWYLNFSKHHIFDEISEHMKKLRKEGKAFDGSKLQIGDTKTTIQINHVDLYWCFIREVDTVPNHIDYIFSGDLISRMLPEQLEDYEFHQKRRELEKEMRNFIDLGSKRNEDDKKNDICKQKEYLDDTEEFLQYEMIFPKAWLNVSNIAQMVEELHGEIDPVFEDGINIPFAVLTVGDQKVILKISNEKLYWWFSLPHHKTPNTEEYIFTGNLLENHFPELIEDKVKMEA